MEPTMLAITCGERTRRVAPQPGGTLIGRGDDCGVLLDHPQVSRHHARIFRDPFGRWIVEDLDSRNGVWVGERRVQAHALLPGERMTIGPFALTLEVEDRLPPGGEAPPPSARVLSDAADVAVLTEARPAREPLSSAGLRELNRVTDCLSALASPGELYPAACRCLAAGPDSAALVVRLPADEAAAGAAPQVLACHVTDRDGAGRDADGANIYLSRRVLLAARSSDEPVTASSAEAAAGQLSLTITDDDEPRVACCAAVGRQGGSADLLYLDVPRSDPVTGMVNDDLPDFARAVARHIRLAARSLQLGEAKAHSRALDHELAMARDIQSRLTPRQPPRVTGVEVAFFYEPAMWVGGDYCDVWLLPDGRLAFAIGDVCGKGLPAAMLMANLQAALRTASRFCPAPDAAVAHVNHHLMEHLPEGSFVSLFVGFLAADDGRLEYVNAGHIPPLLVGPDGRAVPLGRAGGPVLGILDADFTAGALPLLPGMVLLAVTDGITEARSAAGEQLSYERLQQLLAERGAASAQETVRAVSEGVARFCGHHPQQDDATMLALLREAPGSAGRSGQ